MIKTRCKPSLIFFYKKLAKFLICCPRSSGKINLLTIMGAFMTDKQKKEIERLRGEQYSYNRISVMLGIPLNTIKTYCRRHDLGGNIVEKTSAITNGNAKCLMCGVAVAQNRGRKEKKFCSDICRNKWWNSHLNLVNRKANYKYSCPFCKKEFTVYGNSHRKYCSHECYIRDRFGGGI